MQVRRFEFSGPSSEPIGISVSCREPPEAQQGKTLTWQIDESTSQPQQAGQDAVPTADAATPLPQPPASAPDLIGLDIWPASIALCRYLASHPHLVAGQRVVELGAGTGLPGLLCAKLGAASVLLTDYEPAVLAQIQHSVQLNGLQDSCATQPLDFRQPPPAQAAGEEQGSWRLVLAADVLYVGALAAPLARTLAVLLHPGGLALVGHQVRRAIVRDPATRLPRLEPDDAPLEAFKAHCAAAGLRLRLLGSRPGCSNVDEDPTLLLAVGGGGGGGAFDLGSLPGAG